MMMEIEDRSSPRLRAFTVRQPEHLFTFPLRNTIAATADVEKLLATKNAEVSAA